MDVYGADGHHLLSVSLGEGAQQEGDQMVQLTNLLLVVILQGVLISLLQPAEGRGDLQSELVPRARPPGARLLLRLVDRGRRAGAHAALPVFAIHWQLRVRRLEACVCMQGRILDTRLPLCSDV